MPEEYRNVVLVDWSPLSHSVTLTLTTGEKKGLQRVEKVHQTDLIANHVLLHSALCTLEYDFPVVATMHERTLYIKAY